MAEHAVDTSAMRAPRRADAEHNRERILAAARRALETSGDVSMHAIARLAGVGQGTLYRNFPSREALILDLHRQDFLDLLDEARRLASQHPPKVALRAWLDALAAFGGGKDAGNVVLSSVCEQACAESYGAIVETVDGLLRACREAGDCREDLGAEDLLALLGFLWRKDEAVADPERNARLLEIVWEAVCR